MVLKHPAIFRYETHTVFFRYQQNTVVDNKIVDPTQVYFKRQLKNVEVLEKLYT